MIERLMQGIDRTVKYFRYEDPATAAKRVTYDIQAEAVRLMFERFEEDYGTPIFEREWEVLVILDACRTDLMDEVADDYPFLEKYHIHNSLGSNSGQWMKRNFTDEFREEMQRTAVVTGNAQSEAHLNAEDFAILDEVWRYWESEDELFKPDYITDRAISIKREFDPERMVVHYMQPHHPFIPHFDGFDSYQTELHEKWLNPWRDIRTGHASKQQKWREYRDNLEYVLGYVQRLLENIDADPVVISSDHGEAIGEWGIYGHWNIPLRVLRQVPWIETVAEDTGAYDPEFEYDGAVAPDSEHAVDEQLEMLGYL